MKLREWFEANPDVTQEQLGRKVGLTQGRISQIVNNGTAELGTALAIERETDGLVTLPDLLRQPTESAA